MVKSQDSWFRTKLGMVCIVTLFGVLLVANGCTTLQAPSSEDAAAAEEVGEAANSEEAGDSEADAEADSEAAAESDTALVATGEYNGIPVGYTEEGYVFRGSPDAPITIYEYSDYLCPFCRRHFTQTEPALDETYVQSGQVKVVFMDFPLEQLHPNAPQGHAAAVCMAEQSPVAFWEMHALLFETQDVWSQNPNAVTHFIELAQQTDVDVLEFEKCLASGRTEAMVEMTYNAARQLGFSGTPSFQFVVEETGDSYELVGAQPFDRFSSWLDSLAAGEVPADAAAESDGGDGGEDGGGEIPFWATAEGLALDPDKPGFTVAGDHSRGNIDAEVVVIEYSDFQCPFCMRHTTQTQPILDETFVDSGQVRWVFKHFPLNIHAQAPAAGAAAECAAEQGQFWEMHDLLFDNMNSWSISDPNPVFEDLASQLDIDADAFATCLADPAMLERVQSDFAEGRQFVQGTPTFIVMFGEQGRIIPGALPADSFVEALQGVLDAAQ